MEHDAKDYVKCESCKGTKIVMGMGLMAKDCDSCRATGWTMANNKGVKIADVVQGVKRRGRPPKKV